MAFLCGCLPNLEYGLGDIKGRPPTAAIVQIGIMLLACMPQCPLHFAYIYHTLETVNAGESKTFDC